MTTKEKFQKKAAKLRHDADELYTQADQEKDEVRAKELCDQAKAMVDDSFDWDKRAEDVGRLAESKLDDARRVFDGPKEVARTTKSDGTLKGDFISRETSGSEIDRRMEIMGRVFSEEIVSEEEIRSISTPLPHERLWMRALLTEGENPMVVKGLAPLTADEREAYRAGIRAEADARLRFMGVGQATSGAHFVPTIVANRAVATMAHYGVMGDINSGVMVTPLPPGGKIDIPQLTDTHSTEAGQVNEGAATAKTDLTTNEVPLAPVKRSFLLELSTELIQANVVSFEQRVMGFIASFFGRAMNKDLTNGDGTAPNSAGIATGTNKMNTAANDAISESDVLDLYARLDPDYENDPTCVYQAHKSVVANLMKTKGTGDWRAFPLSMDRKLPILPGSIPLRYNQALNGIGTGVTADGNAGADFLVLGCLSKYEVAYSPLRAARDYDVTKDLHQLAFYMSWDGDFGDQRAFHRLENLG